MEHNKKGYLLTRNSIDTQGSTELQFWVTGKDGPALLRIMDENPVLFILSSDNELASKEFGRRGVAAEIVAVELNNFSHQQVSAVYSKTINQHYRLRDILTDAGLKAYESDVRLHDRYLMERFIHGGVEFNGDPVERAGYTEYFNARMKPCEFVPKLRTLSLDIECDFSEKLFSIGLSGCGASEVLMIGKPQQNCDVKIDWYEGEKSLLQGFINRLNELDPDVLIGWNLVNFDFRILAQRSASHQLNFSIGRARESAYWRVIRGESDKGFAWVPGRAVIDGIDALKTATYSFPSFSLDNVARTLIGRGKKVDNDIDHRIEEIQYNFAHDKNKLAVYNLEDCRLVEEIFSHTKILDFLILRSQLTGLEFGRVGGMVAAFYNLYMPKLHRGGFVSPGLQSESGLGSPGGYVMDSNPGLYKNVLVLDFKSLYPSIIRTFKIDPMGLIKGLENTDNAIPGFRGGYFHREKHFLPQIITDLWQQRDIARKNNDSVRSQAIKILMNSFYGVLGTNACRFYDERLTSSITMRGHEIMQTTRCWIEEKGFNVIYGDTDSLFVLINQEASARQCMDIGKSLQNQINKEWKIKLKNDYGLACYLELEFETHYLRFLMPTIRGSEAGSKKRYAGLVMQDNKEKMVFKGLETVRTDWTQLARDFQFSLYEMIFHDENPEVFVKATVESTIGGEHDGKLVYRKQLRQKLDQYVKNVPPHVRAARQADDENRKRGMPLRYQQKGWVNYVLTLNGPEPVEYQQSRIDYQHYVDKQLKPVADGILPFIGLNFDTIISPQTEIF